MSDAQIHVGDIGTRFSCTFTDQAGDPVSLATVTLLLARIQKPSGAVFSKDLTVADAAAGTAYWDSEESDLDEAGTWRTQGYVAVSGWSGHSDILEFDVHANLEEA